MAPDAQGLLPRHPRDGVADQLSGVVVVAAQVAIHRVLMPRLQDTPAPKARRSHHDLPSLVGDQGARRGAIRDQRRRPDALAHHEALDALEQRALVDSTVKDAARRLRLLVLTAPALRVAAAAVVGLAFVDIHAGFALPLGPVWAGHASVGGPGVVSAGIGEHVGVRCGAGVRSDRGVGGGCRHRAQSRHQAGSRALGCPRRRRGETGKRGWQSAWVPHGVERQNCHPRLLSARRVTLLLTHPPQPSRSAPQP